MNHKLLSDQIGNLISRLSGKKVTGRLLAALQAEEGSSSLSSSMMVDVRPEEVDQALDSAMRVVRDKVEAAMLDYNPSEAMFAVMQVVSEVGSWVLSSLSLFSFFLFFLRRPLVPFFFSLELTSFPRSFLLNLLPLRPTNSTPTEPPGPLLKPPSTNATSTPSKPSASPPFFSLPSCPPRWRSSST